MYLDNFIAPSEVIQDLRIVCRDMSAPTDETTHSVTCKYTVEMSVGNGPAVRCISFEITLFFIFIIMAVVQWIFCGK